MAEIFNLSDTFSIVNYSIPAESISLLEIIHFNDAKETNILRTLPQSLNLYVRPRTKFQKITKNIPALGNLQNAASGVVLESLPKWDKGEVAAGLDAWKNKKAWNESKDDYEYYFRDLEEYINRHFFVTYKFHPGMTQPFPWNPIDTNFPSTLPNAYTLYINDFLSVQMIGEPLGVCAQGFYYIQDFFGAYKGAETLKSLIYVYQNSRVAENVIAKARAPLGNLVENCAAYHGFGLKADNLVDFWPMKISNLALRNPAGMNRFVLKNGRHTTYQNYNAGYGGSGATRWGHELYHIIRPNTEIRKVIGSNPHKYVTHNIGGYTVKGLFPAVELTGTTFRNSDISPEDWRIFCGMSGKAYWNQGGYAGNPLGFPTKRLQRDAEFPAVTLTSNTLDFDESRFYEKCAVIDPYRQDNVESAKGLIITSQGHRGLIYSPVWVPITAGVYKAYNPQTQTSLDGFNYDENKTFTVMPWNEEYKWKKGGYAYKSSLKFPENLNSTNNFYKSGKHDYNDRYRTAGDGNALYVPDAYKGGVDTEWYYTDWLETKTNPGSGTRIKSKKYLDGYNVELSSISDSESILEWIDMSDPNKQNSGLKDPEGEDIDIFSISPYAPGQKVKDYWKQNAKFIKPSLPIESVVSYKLGPGNGVKEITSLSPDRQEETVTGKISFTYGIDFDNYKVLNNHSLVNVKPFIFNNFNEKIFDNLNVNSISVVNEKGRIYQTVEFSIIEGVVSFKMDMKSVSRYNKRYIQFIVEDNSREATAIVKYPFIKDSMNISEIQNTSITKVLD